MLKAIGQGIKTFFVPPDKRDIEEEVLNEPALLPEEGKHAATIAADPFSFQAAHRRLAWLLRISAGTNVALVCAVIALVALINSLFPLKEKELGLLRAHPADNRIYAVDPIKKSADGYKLLLESNVRRYVGLILSVNPITHNRDLNEAAQFTDLGFMKKFQRIWLSSDDYQRLLKRKVFREVRVTDAHLAEAAGINYRWVLTVEYVDKLDGREIGRGKRRVWMHHQTRPHDVSEANKFMNPAGMFVVDLELGSISNE